MAQKQKKNRFANEINIQNRRARYDYEFIDTFTAGLVLKGTEIKSIREGRAVITEAHCAFSGDELFIFNMQVSAYEQAAFYNHEPTRKRKLLLNKRELRKMKSSLEEKGLTIVPTRLFISKRGFAKLNIALARGKKTQDKRESIKERDMKREMQRMRF